MMELVSDGGQSRQDESAAVLNCPFCGGSNLLSGSWYIDDSEVVAVECGTCYAGAPADVWGKRHEQTDH